MKYIKIKCSYCNNEFNCSRKKYSNSKKNNRKIFCTYNCYNLSRVKVILRKCSCCGKDILKNPSDISRSKTGNVYCSKSCAVSNNNKLFKNGKLHPNYNTGRSSYRNQKLKELINKCERCGYDECLDILQVHHKDCNRNNNELNNLELLCPNCHSLDHFLKKTGKYKNNQSEV